MKKNDVNYRDFAAYMFHVLGRRASLSELNVFSCNQDLMKITKRMLQNDAFHITFANDTAVPLLTNGILLGGAIQLHSQEGSHRFYSVMFEEPGSEEEYYLMLDATIGSAKINDCSTNLVQDVRLITIENLVSLYSPVMFNLS